MSELKPPLKKPIDAEPVPLDAHYALEMLRSAERVERRGGGWRHIESERRRQRAKVCE